METPEYSATLDYLYRFLPMYQRIGPMAYKADLNNTWALCDALGNPQEKFKSVHVGGTNGKGSSSHLLAAVLQSAGYKTGLYTSPHLKSFTERIKINGQDLSQSFVVEFVRRIKPVLEKIEPSFFETTVAMAFDYFAMQEVDVAVIEVGLGGRLDSTNVITPLVSLITNIGNDHKDLLGETLLQIATEKAGIIKPKVPVVISERQEEIDQVFIRKAADQNSPLSFASDQYQLTNRAGGNYAVQAGGKVIFGNLVCELKGDYQRKNIPGVLATLDKLRGLGLTISVDHIRTGMAGVVGLTQLKGRWQTLNERPLVICDTGHNEDGMREVMKQIRSLHFRQLHIVFGTVKDKDISNVLALLPREADYYFCQAKIPRALPAVELERQARRMGLKGRVMEDVNEAIGLARAQASPDDFIFIGGSTFVVAEIKNL